MIKDDDLQPVGVVEQIQSVLHSEEKREMLSRSIATFAKEHATQEIVETLLSMVKGAGSLDLKKQEVLRH